MVPKYSYLLSGHRLVDYENIIEDYLNQGVKVIWFGPETDCDVLSSRYPGFKKAHILMVFHYDGDIRLEVADGALDEDRAVFDDLSSQVLEFNSEQYLIEHSGERNIIVTASAGTGKTTVMIDRIMFLIHAKGVDPARVTMITFTNEMTKQMMVKLQRALAVRFHLTHREFYIWALERVSQMHISTIHSFAYRLLKDTGTAMGFSNNVSIGSEVVACERILNNSLEEHYVREVSVKDYFGTDLNEMRKLTKQFYKDLCNRGFQDDALKDMEWGGVHGKQAERIQSTLKILISDLDDRMQADRVRGDEVGISYPIHGAHHSLDRYSQRNGKLDFDYLFVDEFQDTDADQIRLIVDIVNRFGTSIFVVGDAKQSIYRFRGAEDGAFDMLRSGLLEACNGYGEYQLINNYRTDASVLRPLNDLFRKWVKVGLLKDFVPLVPCISNGSGKIVRRNCSIDKYGNYLWRGPLLDDVSRLLSSNDHGGNPSVGGSIAILVRTNKQVDDVASFLESKGIQVISVRDRPLFLSDAARDLFAMLSSYLHPNDTKYLFGYLETPYSGNRSVISPQTVKDGFGRREDTDRYIMQAIERTQWGRYKDRFRLRPALSVIREMLDDLDLETNYMCLNQERIHDMTKLRMMARTYRLNLDKILAILHKRFVSDGLDLPHIYDFLMVSIATNRDDEEESIDCSDKDVVYCMTIHKSKGLEFDTVILPFERKIPYFDQSEILVSRDCTRIGWRYYREARWDEPAIDLTNDDYAQIHNDDVIRTKREETRMLYVAMTRVMRDLILYVYPYDPSRYCWSALKAGDV